MAYRTRNVAHRAYAMPGESLNRRRADVSNTPGFASPTLLLGVGRHPTNSYKLWVEGKPPDLAFPQAVRMREAALRARDEANREREAERAESGARIAELEARLKR